MLNDRKVETQMNAQKLWGEALKMKDWMLRESETRRTLHCATENGKKKVKVLVVQSCLFATP